MNFMAEWNRMFDFCVSNMLSKSEILLLHALYMINNKKDWDAWFEADNQLVQRLTGGLSRQSITEARNKLKQMGRIEFKDGKRNQQSPTYHIISFDSKMDMKVDIQGYMEVDKKGDIETDVQGDPNNKLNKTKLNQTKPLEKNSKKIAFIPPTLEEVRDYCFDRGNSVDAKTFFDYYEANNWSDKDGKPVKNWKQRIVSWEGRNSGGNQAGSNKGKYTYGAKHNYDLEAQERKWMEETPKL